MLHMHSKQGLVGALYDQSMAIMERNCHAVVYISENGRYKWYWKTPLSSEDWVRETGIQEILDKMYNEEFAEVSFTGSKKKRKMLSRDKRFMETLDEGTKLKDGHYQIPLPFKQ